MDSNRISFRQIRNRQGELNTNLDSLLAMAGYGPKADTFIREGNFVWVKGIGGEFHPDRLGEPFQLSDVKSESHILIAKARVWIAKNLRAFKRQVKLNEWDAVQLWKHSTHKSFQIVRCKVGDTIFVNSQSSSNFGSGGAWGSFHIYGVVTQEYGSIVDNGFVSLMQYKITFNKGPAAVYTAAGDAVDLEGRVFNRTLYVAE